MSINLDDYAELLGPLTEHSRAALNRLVRNSAPLARRGIPGKLGSETAT